MKAEQWQTLLDNNNWNNVSLRDARYDQVIHLVTAAQGAEDFYTLANNHSRSEPVEEARKLDKVTQQSWVGHPYVDVIDNSTDFQKKVRRAIDAVCNKMGLNMGDRLSPESIKRKFLVSTLPDDKVTFLLQCLVLSPRRLIRQRHLTHHTSVTILSNLIWASKASMYCIYCQFLTIPNLKVFPVFQDFDVVHDYLSTSNPKMQARLRKRGQNGQYTYMHTLRNETKFNGQIVEVRTSLSVKDYDMLYSQLDLTRQSVHKTRRCFVWNNQYFQLDIYKEPCHPRCKGLLILETYTTNTSHSMETPDFLDNVKEVTGDPLFSMFHLSRKD
ncbi:TRPL translocation defect protein 14-like isoform X3 [Acropora palmata]